MNILKNFCSFFFLASVFLLSACQEEDPFVSRAVIEAIDAKEATQPVEHVSFIMDDEVYVLDHFDGTARQITNTPNERKSMVKISHDHRKVAYLNDQQSPVIMDTTGIIIAKLSEHSFVKQMDWSEDDETLYMLVGNEIQFYGPALTIPELTKEPTEEVISAAIIEGTLLYIVRFATGIGQYSERLIIKSPRGKEQVIEKEMGEIRQMREVKISKDKNYFTVAYTRAVSYQDIVKLAIYPMDDLYPELTWETSDRMINPIYDGFSKYIVTATGSSVSGSFQLAAVHTQNKVGEESRRLQNSQYAGKVGAIHVDWK